MTPQTQSALYSMIGLVVNALSALGGIAIGALWQHRIAKAKLSQDGKTQDASADAARLTELSKENNDLRANNASLREEMNELWEDVRKLRREMEADIKALKDECRILREEAGQIPALKDKIREQEVTIVQQGQMITAKDEKIADLNTMLLAASSGQQMAEGVVKQVTSQAERIITALCPVPAEKINSEKPVSEKINSEKQP